MNYTSRYYLPNGLGTGEDCDQGFIKINDRQINTTGGIFQPIMKKNYLRNFLEASPVAVAMRIPGCQGGKLDTKGGRGGVCDRPG
jgi:hypothetical protein